MPVPPVEQTLPKQERGVRRARPLPYDLDVAISLEPAGRAVGLTFTDHYRDGPPTTRRVRQGGSIIYTVGGDTNGWYDVTITSSADSRFIRRLAGHVESGRPSTSDPALGA